MDLGERISPSSVSDLRKALFNVEPLSDARTPLADFFGILLDTFDPYHGRLPYPVIHWFEPIAAISAARELAHHWFGRSPNQEGERSTNHPTRYPRKL